MKKSIYFLIIGITFLFFGSISAFAENYTQTTPDTLTIKGDEYRHIEIYPGWNDDNTGKVLYSGGQNFNVDPETFGNKPYCWYSQAFNTEPDLGAYAVAIDGIDDAFAMDYILVQFVEDITYPTIDQSTVPASVKTGDLFTISLTGDVDLMTSWRPEFKISGVEYEIISQDNKSVTLKALTSGQMTITLHHRSLLVLDDESVSLTVESEAQMPLAPQSLSYEMFIEGISLDWQTVSNAESYTIYRRTDGSDFDQPLASDLESPEYLDDSELPNGDYYYVVTAVNSAGESPHSNEVKVSVTSVVEDYLVSGSVLKTYPNPTMESLNLQFSLASYTTVLVSVRDMTGRELDTHETLGTDISIAFDVSHYPTGVYVLQITLNGETTIRTFIKQ